MTDPNADAVLPPAFLLTAMEERGPDDPVVRLAVQQARSVTSRSDRSTLSEALLSGPLAEEAPAWLLEAAVAADLGGEGEEHSIDRPLSLTMLALGHPSCTADLRKRVLSGCTPQQLARLGSPRAEERLATAVAEAVRALGGSPPSMSPRLLEEATPPQVMLRQGPLHDVVFRAARDTLPTAPDLDGPEGGDAEDWLDRHRRAYEAWGTMWRQILERQPDRHRELVEWADGTDAERTIHDQLLGSLPWIVEPELLTELAGVDLGRFDFQTLLAKGARMSRDGADEQRVLADLAAELSSLTDEERARFRSFLDRRSTTLLDRFCCAPVTWVQHSASGNWRHILHPDLAKEGHRRAEWSASPEILAGLATDFAATAARALPYWEPTDRYSAAGPDEVAWVRDMLFHLPVVTEEIKAAVRPIVRQVRRRSSGSHHALPPRYDQRRQLDEILDTIARVLADPPPATGAERRRAALGVPDDVTVRALADIAPQTLREYLDRHAGDDSLVEKALLAFAVRSSGSDDDFDDVLRRHSAPDESLLRLTIGLRRNLGGSPSWRETWTRLILARPDTGPELVRGLPAWSALRARGSGYGTAHPSVVSVVCKSLASDQAAWDRFASSPATYSGPTAWLRLGDLLNAAAEGTPWPSPPTGR
ncbi:hypothetical protein ACHGLA_35095 [Streptomyces sp. YH02]|uniref:hypothetical protein n=1 Tax=Streptomyces sp. YH02 TaxID=3256999 RepID=UPI0037582B12